MFMSVSSQIIREPSASTVSRNWPTKKPNNCGKDGLGLFRSLSFEEVRNQEYFQVTKEGLSTPSNATGDTGGSLGTAEAESCGRWTRKNQETLLPNTLQHVKR